MLTLLLSAALLAGAETSHNYGERPPGYVAEAVAWGTHGEASVRAGTMDKYTGAGWYARAWLDGCRGHVCVGVAETHRDGGPWTKRVTWLRGGWRSGPWRATVSYASSPDRIVQVWVSGLDMRGHVAVRVEGGPSFYQQPGQDWRVGWHARVMVGVGR